MTARSTQQADGRSKKRPGAAAQRSIILDAAVDLFIERGTSGVSISEICARADVGRQTFYRCFEDKPALLDHLYQHAINEHIERALAQLPARGHGDWPPDIVDQAIDAILANHRLAQLLYTESANPSSPAFATVDRAMDRAARAIQAWYRERLGASPARVHVKAILAATTWLVHRAILSGRSKAAVADAKRASRALFEGLQRTQTAAVRRAR